VAGAVEAAGVAAGAGMSSDFFVWLFFVEVVAVVSLAAGAAAGAAVEAGAAAASALVDFFL
jgi:hypothetical protein